MGTKIDAFENVSLFISFQYMAILGIDVKQLRGVCNSSRK